MKSTKREANEGGVGLVFFNLGYGRGAGPYGPTVHVTTWLESVAVGGVSAS